VNVSVSDARSAGIGLGLGFDAYLRSAQVTDYPVGNLIADLQRDLRLKPAEISDQATLAHHVRCNWPGACPEAVAAVPMVWRRYLAWQHAQATRRAL
jgi:hypothetical protein